MTKPTKWLCAQRRLRTAWASAQSDQSLRCALNGQLRTKAFFMRTAKTLIMTERMPRLIWVFAGRTNYFVGFVMSRLSDLGLPVDWHHLLDLLNPYSPSGIVHPYQMDESISKFRGVWCTFLIFILFLIEISVCKQWRPWSDAAIWLYTACLVPPPPHTHTKKRDARLIWVKVRQEDFRDQIKGSLE